jgi:hypothetical protein
LVLAQEATSAKLGDTTARDVATREVIRKPLASERALAPAGAITIAPRAAEPNVVPGNVPTPAATKPSAMRPADAPTTAAKPSQPVRIPLALSTAGGGLGAAPGAASGATVLRVVGGMGKLSVDAQGRTTLEQAEPGTTIVSSNTAAAIARDSVITTDQKTALPWMVVDVGGRDTGHVVRAARPFLQLARATHWDDKLGRHIAELWVGLDPEGDSPVGKLAQPITASLSVSCEQVEPARLVLQQVGAEGDQLVRVACSPAQKNAQPRQLLTVRVDRGQLEYPFELARRPGRLLLESSASAVAGFGIGSMTLTLTQVEEDGTPLPSREDEEIALIAEGGAMSPSKLVLARGQSSTSALAQVHGVGPMIVRAGSAVRRSHELPIERTWPTVFLLATLLGGALGGYLAVLRLRASSSKRVRTRLQAGMRALEGMLVGSLVVATLLVVPGIAPLVPDAARSSEIGWLILAALAGFIGVELFERLAALVFRKKDDEDKPAAA